MSCFKKVEKSCFDCGKKIKVEGNKIKNGVSINFRDYCKDFVILKCEECFKFNSGFVNYVDCNDFKQHSCMKHA